MRRLRPLHVRVTLRGPSGPSETGSVYCHAGTFDARALLVDIDHMAINGLDLSEAARERVASRFRALGEPTRLRVLERLFVGPASVTEILEHVGGTQANVSKHLALLHTTGLLSRRKDGTRTVYAISDPTLKKICAIVCAEVERSAKSEADAVLGRPRRR